MSTPFVRVDVWSLAENDPVNAWYAKAVAAMLAKPSTDPTSWSYQAAIHGTYAASPLASWNQCRHGSWYFVGWHRMYLYYFERIVRAEIVSQGGPSDWALPYWNYDGGGDHNEIPFAFRSPTANGTTNPLYVSQRAPGINTGSGLPSTITTPAFALGRPLFTGASEFGGGQTSPLGQFFSQTGRLEQTPHNDVHVAMQGLMGDPDTAAEDPIFWLHHSNIDRLWWLWQRQAGHSEPTDPAWAGQTFSFFDVGGAPAALANSGILDTVGQLSYTYDHAPVVPVRGAPRRIKWPFPWPEVPSKLPIPTNPPDPGPLRQLVGATEAPIQLAGGEVRASVNIDERAVQAIQPQSAPNPSQHRAFLDIDDIEAERNPGTVYGVYVNLPEAPTPEDLSNSHVGNVSLFGVERARNPRGDEHGHGLHVSMEITDLLNQQTASGRWKDGGHLDVSFRPLELVPPKGARGSQVETLAPAAEPPVTIGRVSVHFA